MGYGYSFLRTPGGLGDEERGRIEIMEMDELRYYLCAKTHGDPQVCFDQCKGFRTCRVGQRAAVLVQGESNQEPQQEQSEEPAKPLRGKELAKAATESGDPVQYLVQMGKLRKTASNQVALWRHRYPEYFQPQLQQTPEDQPDPGDQISLADFLQQIGIPTFTAKPEPKPSDNPNRRLSELMQQEAKLLEQVAELQESIWQIRSQRREIEIMMSH